MAISKAREYVNGEYYTSIDSDDEIKSNSFEIFINEWNKIPNNKKNKYKCITAMCYNPETGKKIGKKLHKKVLDCSSLDARYKYKMKYDRWSLIRTEIMNIYKIPQTQGRFYPATIIQDFYARDYIERYIDIPLLGCYKDTNNELGKIKLKKENIYLWEHNINDNLDYFFFDIPDFIKSFIGVSMCGFANELKIKDIINRGKGIMRKIGITIFIPIGYILYKKYK